MIRLLITYILYHISLFSFAQSLSNKIVAAGGNYNTSSWGSLSYTIGEVAITSSKSGNFILLQGFQQSYSVGVGILTYDNAKVLSIIYPNPAQSQVCLEVITPRIMKITYIVYDIWGKELILGNFIEAVNMVNRKIDLSGMLSGNYFISIFGDGILLKNFKLQILN